MTTYDVLNEAVIAARQEQAPEPPGVRGGMRFDATFSVLYLLWPLLARGPAGP
jgi:hypothetical protein